MTGTVVTPNLGTAQVLALLAAVVLGGGAVAAWALKSTVLAVIATGLVLGALALLFHP